MRTDQNTKQKINELKERNHKIKGILLNNEGTDFTFCVTNTLGADSDNNQI